MVGVFGPLELDSDELIHRHKTVVGSLTPRHDEAPTHQCSQAVIVEVGIGGLASVSDRELSADLGASAGKQLTTDDQHAAAEHEQHI